MNLLRGPARFILKLLGWKLIDLPQRPAKAVVIAYPHTSNWDFPLTLLALAALPYGAKWVAKDTLFRGACGPLMRGLGGVAVNRRERTGFVERLAEEFRTRDVFSIDCIRIFFLIIKRRGCAIQGEFYLFCIACFLDCRHERR